MPRKTKDVSPTKPKATKKATTQSKATKSTTAKKVVKKAEPKKSTAKKVVKKAEPKKSVTKKVVKKAEPKKSAAKKVVKKAEPKKSVTKKVVKKAEPKKSAAKKVVKKVEPKKNAAKKVVKKVEPKKSATKKVVKKAAPKKSAAKKSTVKPKKSSSIKSKQPKILEYYDLPYRYNQTIVKILAQTPNTLFVYWDISDSDRKQYVRKYGQSFFDKTYPVLIVHNKTMNYSFEIQINDFANSWYFDVKDAKCDYEIELGRRVKPNQTEIELQDNYQHITSSNVIEAPNNHILFEQAQRILFFRNVKTNALSERDASSFEFMKYLGKIYNLYGVYQKMYKDELQDLRNNPSSGFKIM